MLYISAWGLCVARSDKVGNAKASELGVSDMDELPCFFGNPRLLFDRQGRIGALILFDSGTNVPLHFTVYASMFVR